MRNIRSYLFFHEALLQAHLGKTFGFIYLAIQKTEIGRHYREFLDDYKLRRYSSTILTKEVFS